MPTRQGIWLMKTEPDAFSFDDLVNMPNHTDHWDGIRNYQARNFMRDQFKLGDKVFIYHSSCETPGIVGLAKVVREAYPDHTAHDIKSKYYDSKPLKDDTPRWVMVDVQATHRLKKPVSLKELKEAPELKDMLVIKRGQRLSIQPVAKDEWIYITKLGKPQKI